MSKDSDLQLIAELLGVSHEQLFKAFTTVTYNKLSNDTSGGNGSSSSNNSIATTTTSIVAVLSNEMIQQNIHVLMKVLYRNLVMWINERMNLAHDAMLLDDKQRYIDLKQQQLATNIGSSSRSSSSSNSSNIPNDANSTTNNINNNIDDGIKRITIIDTIGLEAFEINSLEQLLINYTAELFQFQCFQQHFSKDIVGKETI